MKKFRIWSELWPVMYTTDSFNEPQNANLFNRYETQYLNNGEYECAIMQFTGLKDRNGVEIYEGDIVKLVYDEAYSPIEPEFTGEVKMIEGCWYIDGIGTAHLVWQEIAEWEVIGNIHEHNPFLS